MMQHGSRIFVAGHRGMVGSAIVRALGRGHQELVFASRDEVDLADADAVDVFVRESKPAYVFLAAARVGGILANMESPVDFLDVNLGSPSISWHPRTGTASGSSSISGAPVSTRGSHRSR